MLRSVWNYEGGNILPEEKCSGAENWTDILRENLGNPGYQKRDIPG